MTRVIIYVFLLMTVVMVPCRGFGAETLRLRYLTALTADNKEAPGQLRAPSGVACDNKSTVIVADSGNNRLVRYSFQDYQVKGGDEIKLRELAYPIHVEINSKGDIYALDGKLRRIVQLNAEGKFVKVLELQGVPAPATTVLRSFAIDEGDAVYLLDIFGERVIVTDAAGTFVKQLPFPKPYGVISDLAVSPAGDVYLLDSTNGAIFVARKANPTFAPLVKNLKEYLNLSTNITTDYRGFIYLTDQNGGAVVAFGQDGAFFGRQLNLGWKSGQLYYPTQMCVTKSGTVMIADRNNNKVQIYEITK